VCVCVHVDLKALYEQSLHIKSAIPHPLIMGVIRGLFQKPVVFHSICIAFSMELTFRSILEVTYNVSSGM